MNNEKAMSFLSTSPKVKIRQMVSILPDSYTLLADKPAINGVELTKDTTLEQLNVLSAQATAYAPITLTGAAQKSMSILAVSENGETARIAVENLLEVTQPIKTVDELDENAEIGTYQKVIIKSEG